MNLINAISNFLKFSVKTQNQNRMHQLLDEIETLLRLYNFKIEANTVEGIIQLIHLDPLKACHLLLDESWWVGSNAVAEANLGIAGGFSSQARLDQNRFQLLIIELYQQLESEGYKSDFARLVTNQYNKWHVSGISIR